MKGKIISVLAVIRRSRLRITAEVDTGKEGIVEAYLPGREVAALIPRQVLVGSNCKATPQLLETILPLASRLIMGRPVMVQKCNGEFYLSFLPWHDVIFEEAVPEEGSLVGGEVL